MKKLHFRNLTSVSDDNPDIGKIRFFVIIPMHDYRTILVDANLTVYSLLHKEFGFSGIMVSDIKDFKFVLIF